MEKIVLYKMVNKFEEFFCGSELETKKWEDCWIIGFINSHITSWCVGHLATRRYKGCCTIFICLSSRRALSHLLFGPNSRRMSHLLKVHRANGPDHLPDGPFEQTVQSRYSHAEIFWKILGFLFHVSAALKENWESAFDRTPKPAFECLGRDLRAPHKNDLVEWVTNNAMILIKGNKLRHWIDSNILGADTAA